MQSGDKVVSPTKGPFHPFPANFQRALTPEPVWIDPPAVALFHHFCPLGDQIQCGESQYQAQPLQRLRRADEGRFELEAIRFVIQAVLFNVKSSPVFFKGLHVSRLITHDESIFFAIFAPSSCQMHRTIMELCQIDVMPKSCFPPCQRETIGFTRPMPTAIDPEAAFQANPPMPI
jgi:hypothetical protein